MEAVPRLHMLRFPSKTSPEGTSFANLKKYIAEAYQENPDAYSKEIFALETLRNQALNTSKDKCIALARYYCQLHSMEKRFPKLEGKSIFTFFWKALYGVKVLKYHDLRFEKACILFNIAAAHTQAGAAVTRTDIEGMKLACTHFQRAAWAYGEVREKYDHLTIDGIDILTTELLVFMQQVSFAQAQECILEKSLIDNRKPNIVARVTAQIIVYYGAALAALLTGGDDGPVAQVVDSSGYKLWTKYVRFKISYLNCILYLYQGQHAEEQKKMGERVTLYEAAWEKLEDARKESKNLPNQKEIIESLTFMADVVEAKRKNANSENEFIYHEAIPELSSLSAVQGANLVKGIGFSINDPDVIGDDIFSRLVPMKAHEASSLYSEEKAKLLRKYSGKIDEKDDELEKFISSLSLDNLNISEETANKIPQGIVDRCAALNANTKTIPELIGSMARLADICMDVEANLTEIGDILLHEEKEEKEFQQLSGVQRTPNAHITELSREYKKYKEAHNKAGESNNTLRKAMELHINNLKILSKPLQEVQQSVPKLSSELNTNEVFKDVKLILNKVNEMKAQRSQFHADLRIAVNEDDITSKLINHGSDEGLQLLFDSELTKHERFTQLIDQNLMAQENILKALTESYAKAAPVLRNLTHVKHKRESFFAALAASYDVYEDLLGKSAKGLEFYTKLSVNIQKLLSRCKSARDVQSEERQQRLIGVSTSICDATASINTTILSNPLPGHVINATPKLRDYLKNKNLSKDIKTSNQNLPSVRPNPLGSENPTQTICLGAGSYYNTNTTSTIIQPPVVGPNEPPPPYSPLQLSYYYMPSMDHNSQTYLGYQQNIAPPAYKPQASPNSRFTIPNVNMVAVPQQQSQLPQQQLNTQNQASIVNDQTQYHMGANIQNVMITHSELISHTSNSNINVTQANIYQMAPNLRNQSTLVTSNSFHNYIPSEQKKFIIPTINNNINMPQSQSNVTNLTSPYTFSGNNNQTVYTQGNAILTTDANTQMLYMTAIQNSQKMTQSQSQSQKLTPHTIPIMTMPSYQASTTVPIQSTQFLPQHLQSLSLRTEQSQGPTLTPIKNSMPIAMDNYSSSTATIITTITVVSQTASFTTTNANSNYFTNTIQSNYPYNLASSKNMYSNDSTVTVSAVNNNIYSNVTVNNTLSHHYGTLETPIVSHTKLSNLYKQQTQQPTGHNLEIINGSQLIGSQQNINYSNTSYGYVTNLATTTINSQSQLQLQPQNHPRANQVPIENQVQQQQQPKLSVASSSSNSDITMTTTTNSANSTIKSITSNTSCTKEAFNNNFNNNSNKQIKAIESSNIDLLSDIDFTAVGLNGSVTLNLPEPTLKPKVLTSPPASQVAMNETKQQTDMDKQKHVEAYLASQIPSSNIDDLTYSKTTTLQQLTSLTDSAAGVSVVNQQRKLSYDNISICSDLSSLDNFDWDSVSILSDKQSITNNQKHSSNNKNSFQMIPENAFIDDKILKYFHKEVQRYEKLIESLNVKMLNGHTPLSAKWKELQDLLARDADSRTTTIARLFPDKNRSLDCLPYDHARVKLDKQTDDYINAAYIKNLGTGCPTFIVAQTPQSNTINDFWFMVWVQKSRTILCLHPPNEILDPFWPQILDEAIHYDDFTVQCVKIMSLSHCNEYQLKLSMLNSDIIIELALLQIKTWRKKTPSQIIGVAYNALQAHQERCLNFKQPTSPLIINCLTGSERSELIALAICAILATQQKRPLLINVVDVWHRICTQRQASLRDLETLEQSMQIVLNHAHDILNKRGIITSYQMKIAPQITDQEKQATKDPLSELDPLWKLK